MGQGFDKGLLLRRGVEGGIHRRRVGHEVSLLGQPGNEGADAGVGVLDIVDRVLAVLPNRQIQIEVQGGGGGAGVEEEAGGVHAHLVQQIPQGDGLAGALGHADGLAVLEEVDQLHQHDDQPVGAVQAQAVQGGLEAGHVAVVVGAPDVDGLGEAPLLQLIAVVGDVGGEVGVEAVGPAEHVVLQVELVHLLLALALGQELLLEQGGGVEPQGPVLLIGPALAGQQLHSLGHVAAVVEG